MSAQRFYLLFFPYLVSVAIAWSAGGDGVRYGDGGRGLSARRVIARESGEVGRRRAVADLFFALRAIFTTGPFSKIAFAMAHVAPTSPVAKVHKR